MRSASENSVGTLTKGFGLIEHLSVSACTLTDLARRTGMPKSSTFRLLHTLQELGIVSRTGEDGYQLTSRLFEYGARAVNARDIVAVAEPEMRLLMESADETVHLAVPGQQDAVHIHRVECRHALRTQTHIGVQVPCHATALGKSLIAWLPGALLETRLKSMDMKAFTPRTLSRPESLASHLADVRARGYAFDGEEHEREVICFGVPVFGYYGHPVAGISISMPKIRYLHKSHAQLAQVLHAAGKAVSQAMGCHDYPVLRIEDQSGKVAGD